jgi:hypothetical protein
MFARTRVFARLRNYCTKSVREYKAKDRRRDIKWGAMWGGVFGTGISYLLWDMKIEENARQDNKAPPSLLKYVLIGGGSGALVGGVIRMSGIVLLHLIPTV